MLWRMSTEDWRVVVNTNLAGASKVGLAGLTRNAVTELGPSNVKVNTVAPGYIRTTELTDRVPPEVMDRARERSTLGLGDGGNAASVLANLAARSPMFKERIDDYLGRITPGVVRVDRRVLSNRETLEFHQKVKGAKDLWRFGATNMSDGTLRALGILLAPFQNGRSGLNLRQPLVGIEEPELALHPAATGVLLDALREASQHSQVLVSSHSADLLDSVDASKESVLAVLAEHGVTRIGPLDEARRSALRKGLFTAGELLRTDQLIPDPNSTNLLPQTLPLFGSPDLAG